MLRQNSEARNLAILSALPDLVFINDRAGTYLDYHASDPALLAANPATFLHKHISEVLPAPIAKESLRCFQQAHETRQTQVMEYSLDLPGGEKHFEARITPIDEKRLLTVVREITDRKKAEHQLAEYAEELEQLYQHLDAELDKARQVHERVLSQELPRVPGLCFAVHYQPAARVGGDFYQVLRAQNKLVVFLSDVTGHGLEGALLSFFVKEAVGSYISIKEEDISPANILDHLDRQYRRESFTRIVRVELT